VSGDAADPSQPSPIGLGPYGSTRPGMIQAADDFLKRESGGNYDPIFLAFNGGRVKGRGLAVPWLNFSPIIVFTATGWWVLDRAAQHAMATGALDEVCWTKTTSDGFKILLTRGRELRFFTSAMNNTQMASVVLAAVANARLSAAGFANEVPAQRPLLVAGAHYGGHGTQLESDAPVVIALSGRGVCAISPSGSLKRPIKDIRRIQAGGVGEYTTGGGWVGGGFGVRGAFEGAAFAAVMNWLTTRRQMDSILRLEFDDAEVTFGLETHAPGRLEIEISAVLAFSEPLKAKERRCNGADLARRANINGGIWCLHVRCPILWPLREHTDAGIPVLRLV